MRKFILQLCVGALEITKNSLKTLYFWISWSFKVIDVGIPPERSSRVKFLVVRVQTAPHSADMICGRLPNTYHSFEFQPKVHFYIACVLNGYTVSHLGHGSSRIHARYASFPGRFYVRWPWPFELKIGKPVTPALGNIHANFGFLRSCSRARSPYATDARTEGRTDMHDP